MRGATNPAGRCVKKVPGNPRLHRCVVDLREVRTGAQQAEIKFAGIVFFFPDRCFVFPG